MFILDHGYFKETWAANLVNEDLICLMMHIAADCLKQVAIMKEVPKWNILTCFQMQVKCSVKHLVEITGESRRTKGVS